MWLSYDHLCNIPEISLTNDFYEILVPVTLPYMRGIYLQYPTKFRRSHLSEICGGYGTSGHKTDISQPGIFFCSGIYQIYNCIMTEYLQIYICICICLVYFTLQVPGHRWC